MVIMNKNTAIYAKLHIDTDTVDMNLSLYKNEPDIIYQLSDIIDVSITRCNTLFIE